MFRRVSAVSTSRAVAIQATGARSIYSIWGTVCHDPKATGGKSFIQQWQNESGTRAFALNNTPVTTTTAANGNPLAPQEVYLLNAIEDDYKRIMSVDWTVEFDPFWADRVESHQKLFNTLYTRGSGLRRMMIGSYPDSEGKLQAAIALNKLQACLKWATACETSYSKIIEERYVMQRQVYDPVQREKILAGCVEVCEEFKKDVPVEFKRKAVADLEWHLGNMRHWIWDCPNAKQTYPRQLA